MADLGETFDPQAIPESEFNGEPLPAGMYQVQISESEVVPVKSGAGMMLKLTFDVIDGPYTNRKLWVQLCIQHQNAQAQSIAQRALADIFQATNTAPSRDSEDLHFKPMMVRVTVKPDEQYGPRNEVKAYKPLANAAPARAPARPAAAPARPAAAAPARGAAAPAAAAQGRPWGNRTPAAAPARAAHPQAAHADDIPF